MEKGEIIKIIFEKLEKLGCEIECESWFDEEAVEGTRITTKQGREIKVYGWYHSDIDLEELLEELIKRED